MAAPTQVYPSWLTPVPFTTEVNGAPVVETSVSFIPLTYIGPSIPLGTVFTFIGSSSPPTVLSDTSTSINPSSTFTQSTSPTTTISSTPTVSPTPTPTATPTSTPAPTSAPSSSASIASPQPVVIGAISHGASIGTKLAVAIPIGLAGLLLLATLAFFLIRRRRRLHENDRFADSEWPLMDQPQPPFRRDAVGTTNGGQQMVLPEVYDGGPSLFSATGFAPWSTRNSYQPVATSAPDADPRTSENLVKFGAGVTGPYDRQSPARQSTIAPNYTFGTANSKGPSLGLLEEKAGYGASLVNESPPSYSTRDYARLPPGAGPPLMHSRQAHRRSLPIAGDQFVPPGTDGDTTAASEHRRHSADSVRYPESQASEMDERATLMTAQRVDLARQVSLSISSMMSPTSPRRNRSLTSDHHLESSRLGDISSVSNA